MKVVLINPDYMKYSSPPLGLASLASYGKKICPKVNFYIYDQMNEKEIFIKLSKQKPDLIGLGAVSENFYEVNSLAKKLKKSFLILFWY